MAKTKKTAVRSTPAKKAAAKQTAKTTTARKAASAPADPTATTGQNAPAAPTDNRSKAELASTQELGQTLADHSLPVHQAAAGNAQVLAAPYASEGTTAATNERVDAVTAAVRARDAEARDLQEKQRREAEGREAQRVENVSVPLGSDGAKEAELRVPDGPVRPAVQYTRQGVSPDVTSPTTGPVVQVPGTGVAKLSELAPGQSLAPSPPISSSNILPQPDKPSFG